MKRNTLRLALPLLLATLSACAGPGGGGRYPSLGIRDVERAQGQFEPVPAETLDVPAVPAPLEGPVAEQLDTLRRQAGDSHEKFLAAQPDAARLAAAAAGSEVGSDAWASAQVALSDLDSIRSLTAVALGHLDNLSVGATVQAEDHEAIDRTRAEVLALVVQEDETLAELRGKLGG